MMRTVELAAAAKVGRDSAAQAILLLAREGFIATTRGRHGGVGLAMAASEILLGDVLRRVQPELFLNVHTDRDRGDGHAVSPFDLILGAADATCLAFLDRFSIADLAECRAETAIRRDDRRLNEIVWSGHATA